MNSHRILNGAVICSALLAAGCKTPPSAEKAIKLVADVNRDMPWYDENTPRQGVPTRIEENWSDTVLYQQGKRPVRGFGGRLMFYGDETDRPILVDGQLVVYAFRENGRAPTDNMPTRRYVFPAEQLEQWMSVGELGASYSVWLPWDEAGGPQTEISLISRFEPKLGPVVIGKQTRQLLPGDISPSELAAETNPKMPEGVPFKSAVELAAYAAPAPNANRATQSPGGENNPPTVRREMTSTTIALPESMRNFGQGANYQEDPNPSRTRLNGGSPDAGAIPQGQLNGAQSGASEDARSGYRLTSNSPGNTRYNAGIQRASTNARDFGSGGRAAAESPQVTPNVRLHSNGHDVAAAMTRRPSTSGYSDQRLAPSAVGGQSSAMTPNSNGNASAATVQ